jgi:hypothetical protein
LRLLRQQGVQHGQQESGCFAAAGLAGHHQIGKASRFIVITMALHGNRNGLELHRGWLGKTQVFDRLDQGRSQAQGF